MNLPDDAPECPLPHLSADAARWLLSVTGDLTVKLGHPHAVQTTAMAAAVRGELSAIVAAAEDSEPEVPPEEPDGE